MSFIEDRVEWHHRVPTDAELAAALAELDGERMTGADCRVAFAETLVALAEADSRIVAVCNDSVGSSNLKEFKQRFPDRLINVGIAEQNLVGVSAGLASAGKIPFTCGASCFLTGRALEQIKADLAYSRHNVKLCGMSSGMAYGELGPTHHSIEDLAWTRAIANMTVIVPADPIETAARCGRPPRSTDRSFCASAACRCRPCRRTPRLSRSADRRCCAKDAT